MREQHSIVLALGAGLVCLWLAGGRHDALRADRMRTSHATIETLDHAPPLLTLITVAMGGFRGVVADILWLRLSHLQDAGEYFEMVQLADWISKMQPHSAEIWEFHAWNMAYNVSVIMPDPEDRWRWVWHGISLLRDEGIVYNPGSPRLYHQLAWVFFHKIGKTADTAHEHYRQRLAEKTLAVLGSAQPDYDVLSASPERVRRLRETLRMDVGFMRETDARYGPLDWTRPESHAVYWAELGRRRNPDKDVSWCERIIVQSLQAMAEQDAAHSEPAAEATEKDDRPLSAPVPAPAAVLR